MNFTEHSTVIINTHVTFCPPRAANGEVMTTHRDRWVKLRRILPSAYIKISISLSTVDIFPCYVYASTTSDSIIQLKVNVSWNSQVSDHDLSFREGRNVIFDIPSSDSSTTMLYSEHRADCVWIIPAVFVSSWRHCNVLVVAGNKNTNKNIILSDYLRPTVKRCMRRQFCRISTYS